MKKALRIAGMTAVGTLFSVGCATAAGATGAAILSSTGHNGYSPLEAAKMGAIGAGILATPCNIILGCLALLRQACTKEADLTTRCIAKTPENILYFLYQIIYGLTGYAVMNAVNPTTMSIDKTAAAFATGTVVTGLPLGLIAWCAVIPLLYLLTKCADDNENEEELMGLTFGHII